MRTLLRSAALALVGGSLLAGGMALPAAADDDDDDRKRWKRSGWHHDHGYRWDKRDRRHWDRKHHHHHHHRDVYVYERKRRGDTGLAFGLGAITGLAAGALLAAPPAYAAPPPPAYYPPSGYVPPAVTYADPGPLYATPTGRTANNGYCREYQTQVQVGGRVEPAYGMACLQPDGSWRRVD